MHCVEAMKKVQSHSIAITRRNLATLPAQGDRSRGGESCRSQGRSARPLPELADARNEGIAGRHAHVGTAGRRGTRRELMPTWVSRGSFRCPRGYRPAPRGRWASLDARWSRRDLVPTWVSLGATRSCREVAWGIARPHVSRRELIPTWVSRGSFVATWVSIGATRSLGIARRQVVAPRAHTHVGVARRHKVASRASRVETARGRETARMRCGLCGRPRHAPALDECAPAHTADHIPQRQTRTRTLRRRSKVGRNEIPRADRRESEVAAPSRA